MGVEAALGRDQRSVGSPAVAQGCVVHLFALAFVELYAKRSIFLRAYSRDATGQRVWLAVKYGARAVSASARHSSVHGLTCSKKAGDGSCGMSQGRCCGAGPGLGPSCSYVKKSNNQVLGPSFSAADT